MAHCTECGSELSGGEQFCPDCGADTKQVSKEEPEDTDQVSKEEPVRKLESTDETLVFASDLEEKIAYGGAGVSIVGSFLPWASILGVTVLGIEGDGIITLILAGILAGAVYQIGWERQTMIGAMAVGVLVFVVALTSVTSAASIGVYVTMVGGLGMIVAGQSGYRRSN